MGKKKKEKKGKLSDDERLMQLEQQSIKAMEMKRRREEMMRAVLKDRLMAEEKNSNLNTLKIRNQWRVIKREAKSKDLKKELEVLQQTFDREVDRKDAIIQSLSRDLEEAEEQFQTASHSHVHNMDHLLSLQRQQVSQRQGEFEGEVKTLMDEFGQERTAIMMQQKEEMEGLMDVMYAMEREFVEQESEARQELHSTRDEVKNKNLEEKHALRIQLEGNVEDLWRHFQNALNNYNANTEERKQQFESLKANDQHSAETIELQMRKLQRLQESVSQVKARMAGSVRECEERNQALRQEKEGIAVHFQELKARMNLFREAEARRLTALTLQSNRTLKDLKGLEAKAERILKLAEMNRKMETEEEKVSPFYPSSISAEEAMQAWQERQGQAASNDTPLSDASKQEGEPVVIPPNLQHSVAVTPVGRTVPEYSALDNFWKRYNKVLLDKLALDKEKQSLLEENQGLRAVLKQYLDGISVNEEVLAQKNPLFVVNGRTNVNLQARVGDPRVARPTAVEALHVVNAQRLA